MLKCERFVTTCVLYVLCVTFINSDNDNLHGLSVAAEYITSESYLYLLHLLYIHIDDLIHKIVILAYTSLLCLLCFANIDVPFPVPRRY